MEKIEETEIVIEDVDKKEKEPAIAEDGSSQEKEGDNEEVGEGDAPSESELTEDAEALKEELSKIVVHSPVDETWVYMNDEYC